VDQAGVLLNGDLHSKTGRPKMSYNQFSANIRENTEVGVGIPSEVLRGVYTDIKQKKLEYSGRGVDGSDNRRRRSMFGRKGSQLSAAKGGARKRVASACPSAGPAAYTMDAKAKRVDRAAAALAFEAVDLDGEGYSASPGQPTIGLRALLDVMVSKTATAGAGAGAGTSNGRGCCCRPVRRWERYAANLYGGLLLLRHPRDEESATTSGPTDRLRMVILVRNMVAVRLGPVSPVQCGDKAAPLGCYGPATHILILVANILLLLSSVFGCCWGVLQLPLALLLWPQFWFSGACLLMLQMLHNTLLIFLMPFSYFDPLLLLETIGIRLWSRTLKRQQYSG
jgi:hypothetical protein